MYGAYVLVLFWYLKNNKEINDNHISKKGEHKLAYLLHSHKTREIRELINEIKELRNVVGNRWGVRILSLQMLFINLTNAFHALIHGLEIGVSSRLRFGAGLHQQDCVRLEESKIMFKYYTRKNQIRHLSSFSVCNKLSFLCKQDRN